MWIPTLVFNDFHFAGSKNFSLLVWPFFFAPQIGNFHNFSFLRFRSTTCQISFSLDSPEIYLLPLFSSRKKINFKPVSWYGKRRLIGPHIIVSAAYCNQIQLDPLSINCTQNTLVNWIIRLLLSLLCCRKWSY